MQFISLILFVYQKPPWFLYSFCNLEISGYTLVCSDHPSNNKRGDVCIYYKTFLDSRQRGPIKLVLLVIIGWLVTQFSLIFCMKWGSIKVEKWQSRIFEKQKKKFLIWRIRKKVCKLAHQTNTLIFFSKTAGTIFLVFGLKLVLNMTFNLNETYFSEKIAIWRYLTSKSSKKITQNEVSGHFLDFASLVFLDFADNDRWSWCLVVLLQFTGPFNVFFLPFRIINV